MVFIDLKKAYGNMTREVNWRCMEVKGVLQSQIRAFQDKCKRMKTSEKFPKRNTKYFPIDKGHQGPALNPFLFALILEEFRRTIQDEVPWCILLTETSQITGSLINCSSGWKL